VTRRRIVFSLPHLDGATAATLLELCGQLQVALWRIYGDEIEAYWTETDPEQPIYGPLPWRRR
jgi:hypothetical protein